MKTGKVIEMLRKTQGLTQAQLAANITTRKAIIEAEHKDRVLPYNTMIKIIERLGVSLHDFEDYRHDHQSPADQALVYQFEHLSDTSQMSELQTLLVDAQQLLSSSNLKYIHQLIPILVALIHIDSYSREQLTTLVMPVWNEVTATKNWSKTDFFLINNMLYIFDPLTAQQKGKRVLERIDQYSPRYPLLKNAIVANLAYMGIKNPGTISKDQIRQYLNESIHLTKQNHRYDLRLLSIIRLAVLNHNIDQARQACDLLDAMGAKPVADIAKQDFPELVLK